VLVTTGAGGGGAGVTAGALLETGAGSRTVERRRGGAASAEGCGAAAIGCGAGSV